MSIRRTRRRSHAHAIDGNLSDGPIGPSCRPATVTGPRLPVFRSDTATILALSWSRKWPPMKGWGRLTLFHVAGIEKPDPELKHLRPDVAPMIIMMCAALA